jgi:hypothetical protein
MNDYTGGLLQPGQVVGIIDKPSPVLTHDQRERLIDMLSARKEQ